MEIPDPANDGRTGRKLPYQSVRPDKGMAARRFPAARRGYPRTEP